MQNSNHWLGRSSRVPRLAFVLLAATAVAAPALGQQTGQQQFGREFDRSLAVRFGLVHTDNLGRTGSASSSRGGSSTFETVGADIAVLREGNRIRAYSAGSLDFLLYSDSDFDNEVVGRLSSGLDIKLAPVLAWEFTNDIGNVRSDPYRASGPGNQQHVIVNATGPTLTVPFGTNVFQASARITERAWEDNSLFDSEQTEGDIGLFRNLSPSRRIGLFLQERRTEFDSGVIPRYDAQLAAFQFRAEGSSTMVSLSAGMNRLRTPQLITIGTEPVLDPTTGLPVLDPITGEPLVTPITELTENPEYESKPYFDAVINFRPAPRSTFILRAGRRYEDSVDRIAQGRRSAGTVTGGVFAGVLPGLLNRGDLPPEVFDSLQGGIIDPNQPFSAGPYDSTQAGLSYVLTRRRVQYTISTERVQERYETFELFDRTRRRNTLGFIFSITPAMLLNAQLQHGVEDFEILDVRATDRRVRLSLARQLTQAWNLTFALEKAERESVADFTFDETRFSVVAVWSPFGPMTAMPRVRTRMP